MRTAIRLLVVLAFLTATACTEQSLPVLGEPFPVTVPAGENALGPRLAQDSTDSAILSWMERGEDSTTIRFSIFELGAWQPAKDVIYRRRIVCQLGRPTGGYSVTGRHCCSRIGYATAPMRRTPTTLSPLARSMAGESWSERSQPTR